MAVRWSWVVILAPSALVIVATIVYLDSLGAIDVGPLWRALGDGGQALVDGTVWRAFLNAAAWPCWLIALVPALVGIPVGHNLTILPVVRTLRRVVVEVLAVIASIAVVSGVVALVLGMVGIGRAAVVGAVFGALAIFAGRLAAGVRRFPMNWRTGASRIRQAGWRVRDWWQGADLR